MDGTVLTSCDTLTGAVFSIVSWPTEIRLDPTGATPRMAEPVTMMSLSATDWLHWGGGAMVALSCASAGWPATIAAAIARRELFNRAGRYSPNMTLSLSISYTIGFLVELAVFRRG